MPTYDYLCGTCGPFALFRPISEHALDQDCPACRTPSPRAVFTAPALGGAADRRAADVRRNRSLLGQKLSAMGHGANCACCRR